MSRGSARLSKRAQRIALGQPRAGGGHRSGCFDQRAQFHADIVQLPTDMSARRRYPDSVTAVVGSATRVWRPEWPCAPYDILRALRRGAGDPSFRRDSDGTLWRAVITPDGPVTIRITARPADAEIEFEAWGSGAALDARQRTGDARRRRRRERLRSARRARTGGLGQQSALAGDQDPAGTRGARGFLPRAEGHRPRSLDRLAQPALPIRRRLRPVPALSAG